MKVDWHMWLLVGVAVVMLVALAGCQRPAELDAHWHVVWTTEASSKGQQMEWVLRYPKASSKADCVLGARIVGKLFRQQDVLPGLVHTISCERMEGSI